MKIRTSAKQGFTLVEIMIAVAIVGVLAAIAVPNYVRARTSARESACINNLRVMDAAMVSYVRDNRKNMSESITLDDIKPYIKLTSNGTLPGCPSGGSYSVGVLSNGPSCNITGHVLQ